MIDSTIAVIDEAQVRNFQRWPILEEYVWPNAYVGGSYENEIDYLTDWITARLDWMDEQTMSANDDPQIISSYSLDPAYPNPFNNSTTIRFDIPVETQHAVSLWIFDITGRVAATLINEPLKRGAYEITWHAAAVPSGVYVAVLSGGGVSVSRKLVLLK
jgi:hypothetical protein